MTSMIPAAFLFFQLKTSVLNYLSLLKPYTLFIYCSHYILMQFTNPIMQLFPNCLGYILRVVVIVLLACILAHILQSTKSWKYINGGRL